MIRDMRIRAAGPADVAAITEVFHACGLMGGDIDPSSSLYSLAVQGEKVIGCACGEVHEETVIIQAAAVLDQYRGRQVATHLVRAILMRARANGCTRAAVLTSEHPAFFARFGFTLTALDDMPQKMKLTTDFLRRFGARTHYMCRHLD
ncbi:GNAT family N-acetyltransferase [Cupriavidus pinatubonensis]|uniref:GCN5-related N-acetyltransferase n=2 Tax=Burkholderiaceae TaxID=119060 RepID=Q46N31_CUPPJ|nr:GNAT family N-acetyltransferase [Cupriavidus pinatubonensis]